MDWSSKKIVIMEIILVAIPIFLIIFFGWLLARVHIADAVWAHVLNAFAYYVSLPALVVSAFWVLDFAHPQTLLIFVRSASVILLFMFVVLALLAFLPIKRPTKAAIFLVATCGNTIYMGIPIVSGLVGDGAHLIFIASILLIFPIVFSIGIVRWWSDSGHSLSFHLLRFLKNPLFISFVVGIGISFVPLVGVWSFVYETLLILGSTASPVALCALGIFLYKRFLKRRLSLALGASFLKLLAFPFFVWLVLDLAHISFDPALFLFAAMPAAVTSFVIAEQFKLDATLVGNVVVFSTIFSFISIPLVFALYG